MSPDPYDLDACWMCHTDDAGADEQGRVLCVGCRQRLAGVGVPFVPHVMTSVPEADRCWSCDVLERTKENGMCDTCDSTLLGAGREG